MCNNQKSIFENNVRLFPLNFPAVQDPETLFNDTEMIQLQFDEELINLDAFIAD